MTSQRDLDYLGHLARESARFADVLASAPAGARVPSCPDWNADDLLWHLGEVQWFWGSVVAGGVLTDEQAEQVRAERPASRAEVADFFASASRKLGEVLTAPPETPAWTWADDHSVGFIRRRQAHEALIHRIDAELTAGSRTAMDPRLSADGVDEALRLMYDGDIPAWGTFAGDDARTLRIKPADADGSWLVTLGRLTGTDPLAGKQHDKPAFAVAAADQGNQAAATIQGSAADLDCWLWGRPTLSPLGRAGDPAVLAAFDSAIAAGIG